MQSYRVIAKKGTIIYIFRRNNGQISLFLCFENTVLSLVMNEKLLLFAESAVHTSLNHLEKRNIQIGDKRTSVRLEPVFWEELKKIAIKENISIHEVCGFIDKRKNESSSLSSALRVFVVSYIKASGPLPENPIWDGHELLDE